jgi:tRNA dimethylallyltransferase
MDKIIVIAGPTGSGKTALAVKLARKLNCEIISADSRQVYKYLDVGTNKEGVWSEELGARAAEGVPQYLTDIIEPGDTFSAGQFVKRAGEFIKKIRGSGKRPLIVGGTGLYIKALIDGIAELPDRNEPLRQELNALLSKHGKEYLYDKLKKFDPVSAEKNRGNPQRLIRSLEVHELTGVPITELHKNTRGSNEEFLQFAVNTGREELYKRIDARSAAMLDSGMIEETKKVLDMGFGEDSPGLQGLGYRDAVRYLKNEITLDELRALLQAGSRRYAKRQLTWFKKDSRIKWLGAENIANVLTDLLK